MPLEQEFQTASFSETVAGSTDAAIFVMLGVIFTPIVIAHIVAVMWGGYG